MGKLCRGQAGVLGHGIHSATSISHAFLLIFSMNHPDLLMGWMCFLAFWTHISSNNMNKLSLWKSFPI